MSTPSVPTRPPSDLDDTGAERSTPAFAQAIEEDLRWLGLDWDEKAVQSERLERYAAAAGRLKAAGRLYACYETPEELGLKRKVALSAGRPPIYDRDIGRRASREGGSTDVLISVVALAFKKKKNV